MRTVLIVKLESGYLVKCYVAGFQYGSVDEEHGATEFTDAAVVAKEYLLRPKPPKVAKAKT